jgi:tight adherence protein C
MTTQIVFLVVVFLSVFGVGLVLTYVLTPNALRERLDRVTVRSPTAAPPAAREGWIAHVVKLTGPLGKLSIPDEGWERSPIRVRFMNAGKRGPMAPAMYFAAKTTLAIALPVLWFLFVRIYPLTVAPEVLMFSLVVACAIGYYLPNLVLDRIVAERKLQIFENFPDAIDLMTVCVEAGLGLDAAMVRVADEMKMTSKPLAEELHLVTLELRAGASKEKALRNLALRTGVEEVDALVAMLIQSERFGTSMADSLRIHSDGLRTKRRLRAEEAAAKIPVKMVFPLIVCIFPSLLLVAAGPAVIRIGGMLFPALSGGGQ